jgi:hypothetical protein
VRLSSLFLNSSSNQMNISPDVWLMIAQFLGEDALGLAFAIRECDPDLAEHIYQIAEDHHIAAQGAVHELSEPLP